MTKLIPAILVLGLVSQMGCAGSHQASYKSQLAPGYVKKDYKKIMVFAPIEEDVYRKNMEDEGVKELASIGYSGITAYANLKVSYTYDSTEFMNTINGLGVDGFLALRYLGKQTRVEDRYRYTGGYYNMLTGTVPFDLDTKAVKTGYIQVDFFNLDSRAPQWPSIVPADVTDNVSAAIERAAREAVRRLRKDGVL